MTADPLQQPDMPRWLRPLLPADMHEEPRRRRSAGDWILDLLAFLFAIGISLTAMSTTWREHSEPGIAVDLVLGAIVFVAMWWRRAHPVGFGVVSALCGTVSVVAAGPALVGLFNATVRAPARGLAAVVAASVVAILVLPLLYPGGETYLFNVVLGVLITVLTIGWGLFMRVRRELVRSLRERAERAEEDRRVHADQAREAERRRIAREMHDVLAHRVSLLSLHAGALEFRPDAPPAEIAEAAGVIRAAARDALRELREVIGVLREGTPGERPEPPQPTLAQVPALVEESRAAGVRVELLLDADDVGAVGDALGRTAYRIVQEGLTNARKHAPGAAVEVAIGREGGAAEGGAAEGGAAEGGAAEGALRVEVVSRPAIGAAAVGAPLPGAGTGLIGLAERVALAGGTLSHGFDARGDFVLKAVLP